MFAHEREHEIERAQARVQVSNDSPWATVQIDRSVGNREVVHFSRQQAIQVHVTVLRTTESAPAKLKLLGVYSPCPDS